MNAIDHDIPAVRYRDRYVYLIDAGIIFILVLPQILFVLNQDQEKLLFSLFFVLLGLTFFGGYQLNQKSRVMAKEKGWGKHGEKKEYVLFYPDLVDMQNSLNLSKLSIQKYLKAFCDSGILKKLGKSSLKGVNVYAAGFWSVYGEEGEGRGIRRNYFLKNSKDVRAALRKFKVKI